VLSSGATLVAITEQPAEGNGGRADARSVYFVVRPDAGQLRELAALIDTQQLRPIVSAVFELSALPEAFRAQRARRAPGKVVISIGSTAGR
jgi:NADPH:quinone reductase-like Zn-dependent oxidoreductase